MTDYLRHMIDLTLRKELQGIHFWASVYVIFIMLGTLWHILRVRCWPAVTGRLLRIGVRPLGAPEIGTGDQDYVPDALYEYQVDGKTYKGQEISVWKMSASGFLRGSASAVSGRVRSDQSGAVSVYYNPKRPQKSLLLRPGWASLLFVWAVMLMTAGFYVWRW